MSQPQWESGVQAATALPVAVPKCPLHSGASDRLRSETCGDLPRALRIPQPHRHCPPLCPWHGWAEPSFSQAQHSPCHLTHLTRPGKGCGAGSSFPSPARQHGPRTGVGRAGGEVLPALAYVFAYAWCQAQGCPGQGTPLLPAHSTTAQDRATPPALSQQAGPLAFPPQQLPYQAEVHTPPLPESQPCSPPLTQCGSGQPFPEPHGRPARRPHLLALEPGAVLNLQTQTALPGQIQARTATLALTSRGGRSHRLLGPFPWDGQQA